MTGLGDAELAEISRPTSVRWAGAARPPRDGVIARLTARFPAVLLPHVIVRCERQRALGPVEKLALEVARHLGHVDAEDLAALTGLPPAVGRLLLARLVTGGVLGRVADKCVLLAAGRAALNAPVVVESREQTEAFVFLPRTGDLVPAQRALYDAIQKIRPGETAPVPAFHRQVDLVELVRAAFAEDPGRFPEDAVGVSAVRSSSARLPDRCPVWQAQAELVADGDHDVVDLLLTGRANSARARIDVRTRLTAGWRALAEAFLDVRWWEDALVAQTGARPPHLRLEPRGPCAYRLGIARETAEGIARSGISLVQPRSLLLASEVAEVDAIVHLEPLDGHAASLFVLDKLAERVRTADLPNDHAALASAGPQEALRLGAGRVAVPGPDDVRRRLWQLKEYETVYKLREKEDFTHDG